MDYTHETFIEELGITYKFDKKKDGSYDFRKKGYLKKQVAKQLLVTHTDFSKMLHDQFLGDYKPVIQVIIKHREVIALEKRIRELNEDSPKQLKSPKPNILLRITIGALSLIAFAAYVFNQSIITTSTPNQNNTENITSIYNYKVFQAIYLLDGIKNANELAKGAVKEKIEIQKLIQKNGELTNTDKIESIRRLNTMITTVMGDSRNYIRGLDIKVKGEKNISDFIEHLFPIDSLIRCPLEELALSKNLPECATNSVFDKGLFEASKLIFAPEDKDMNHYISIIVSKIQNEQGRFTKDFFECYMKNGEDCFIYTR